MDDFAKTLLQWYQKSGRKDLPWQHPREPYRVWLSEIMLQQTQVATVIPYFEKFTQEFPSVTHLANAHIDEVLALWAGLGYYARARNLHAAAIQVRDQHQGIFPSNQEALEALPGIGRSTAGAIRAQAFAQPGVILDANVRRVLCRYHGVDIAPLSAKGQVQLWQLAETHTPAEQHADYAQAIMDLGATVCARRAKCAICPLQASCVACLQERQEELPLKPAKKSAKPIRQAKMHIHTNGLGEVFLEKRPPTGIWGGLFCPPIEYLEDSSQANFENLAAQANQSAQVEHLPQRRHTFSHFHLDFVPVLTSHSSKEGLKDDRVSDSTDGLWYNLSAAPPGGFPKPVTELLAELAKRSKPSN